MALRHQQLLGEIQTARDNCRQRFGVGPLALGFIGL